MATNPAGKRMSNPTKKNKRIGNKARNEAIERKASGLTSAYASVTNATAFRHVTRQENRTAFRAISDSDSL